MAPASSQMHAKTVLLLSQLRGVRARVSSWSKFQDCCEPAVRAAIACVRWPEYRSERAVNPVRAAAAR
eukprot:1158562-Prymnesium_polylepis.1